jgi:hypothetical protein
MQGNVYTVWIVSVLVIFVCGFLLWYWLKRTILLLHGSEELVDEVLQSDLWSGRRVLAELRAMFTPDRTLV